MGNFELEHFIIYSVYLIVFLKRHTMRIRASRPNNDISKY